VARHGAAWNVCSRPAGRYRAVAAQAHAALNAPVKNVSPEDRREPQDRPAISR